MPKGTNVGKVISTVLVIILCFIVLPFCIVGGCALNFFGNGVATVSKEFSPAETLRKYTYLKSVAAQLTAKKQSIEILVASQNKFKEGFSKPIDQWPRDVREIWFQRETELAGLKMSFNTLAGEYNQLMSQFNWRFSKVGLLPHGAEQVLPGEGSFSQYLDN